jgi:hypothetical protein
MEGKNANQAILSVNGLRYVMPKPLSTTLVASHKKQYAQSQSYKPNSTIVFDINSTNCVDPMKSYLKFQLNITGGNANFGDATALNLINEIRVQSKNGTELDRCSRFNDWAHFHLKNMISQEEYDDNALNLLRGVNLVDGPESNPDYVFTVIVPLKYLSGLFNPHVKGQKMPPSLLSGSRIELVLESLARAFVDDTSDNPATVTDYTILRPEIVLYEHSLNDNTLKMLNSESQNGLEYVYSRYFHNVEKSSNTTFTSQIKKAVSQATSCHLVIKDADDENDVTEDSFKPELTTNLGFRSFQLRCGSNYYPFYKVQDLKESVLLSKDAIKAYTGETRPTVTTQKMFETDVHFSQGLMTDHNISSSGIAVNNSSTIQIDYEHSNPGSLNFNFHTFLVYTCLARCFLNQVSVKI